MTDLRLRLESPAALDAFILVLERWAKLSPVDDQHYVGEVYDVVVFDDVRPMGQGLPAVDPDQSWAARFAQTFREWAHADEGSVEENSIECRAWELLDQYDAAQKERTGGAKTVVHTLPSDAPGPREAGRFALAKMRAKRQPTANPTLRVDWRGELKAFRAHVRAPEPCPSPALCDNYSCDVNRVAIKAFTRVDDLLAATEHEPPLADAKVADGDAKVVNDAFAMATRYRREAFKEVLDIVGDLHRGRRDNEGNDPGWNAALVAVSLEIGKRTPHGLNEEEKK